MARSAYFLHHSLQKQLVNKAWGAIERFQQHHLGEDGWIRVGDILVVCLQHVIDRLCTIPAIPGVVIGLATHIQWLTLELAGMVEWLTIVQNRMKTKCDC